SRDTLLNSRRGSILVPLSEFKNEDNIQDRLHDHLLKNDLPVSNVKVYKKTSRHNATLTCASITFDSRKLPEEVRIGFKKVKVKEDLPKPRQCHSCWSFGHLETICRSDLCCPVCADPNHSLDSCPIKDDINYRDFCINCNENGHIVISKKCFLYQKELETLIIMNQQGIPKYEARRLLEDSGRFKRNPRARKPYPNKPNKQPDNTPQQQQEPSTTAPTNSEDHPGSNTTADANQNPPLQAPALNIPEQIQATNTNTSESTQAEKPVIVEPPLTGNGIDVEEKLREILGYAGNSSPTLSMDEPFLSFSVDTDAAETSDDPISSQIPTRKIQQQQSSETVDTSEDPIPSQVFTRRIPSPRPQRTPKRGRENNHSSPSSSGNQPKRTMPDNVSTSSYPASTSSPIKSSSSQRTKSKDIPAPLSTPPKVTTLDKPKGAKPKKEPKDGQHRDIHDCGCHSCIKEMAIVKNEATGPGEQFSTAFLELVKQRTIHYPIKLAFHPQDCMCRQHILKQRTTKTTNKGKGLLVANIRKSFENLRKKDNKPRSETENEPGKTQEGAPNKQPISVITSR
ncbi:MAG: hypothetical protein AAFW00_28090, partial [Bacteroidota bacterium]